MNLPSFPSLEPLAEKLLSHCTDGHDTALVAAPGSGSTTFAGLLRAGWRSLGTEVIRVDMRNIEAGTTPGDALRAIPVPIDAARPRILVLNHVAYLALEDQRAFLEFLRAEAPRIKATCLWVGALDARTIQRDFGVGIHSVPRSHLTFPVMPRDEILLAYRSIAESQGCRWGEAILFLLLDLCGNDLALVRSIAEYLYGDWSDKLYDASVWDRINEWLARDPVVNGYRQRLKSLPESCQEHLMLIRLGGKPVCPRTELLEEVDAGLRTLYLQGFLVQNLLPRFYQLRNLTARLLVSELSRPEVLFRRTANERVGQLLQDVETMLRGVLQFVFNGLGDAAVRTLLERKQSEGEFMPPALNKALLEWADKAGGADLRKSLNDVLLKHRAAFRAGNSIWAKVSRMMASGENAENQGPPLPEHLRCVDYMTFGELSDVLMELFDNVFPRADANKKNIVKERWRESLAMVRRLRNDVAHLRSVSFQDMEDLAGTVERMRKDLIDFSGWR